MKTTSPQYYILKSTFKNMLSESSIPLLEDGPDSNDFPLEFFSVQPFEKIKQLTVSFIKNTPLLDYIKTAHLFDLVSSKMRNEIFDQGSVFESIPIKIIDRKSEEEMDLVYFMIHFLEEYDVIDYKKSQIGNTKISKIVIDRTFIEHGIKICKQKSRNLLFIREDLKIRLEHMKITGLEFIPSELYKR